MMQATDSKLAASIAQLEATAQRAIESGRPGAAAKGRAVQAITIPITKWLDREMAISRDPELAVHAFTQAIAQVLVMVADQASAPGADPLLLTADMLKRIKIEAAIHAAAVAAEGSDGKS